MARIFEYFGFSSQEWSVSDDLSKEAELLVGRDDDEDELVGRDDEPFVQYEEELIGRDDDDDGGW
jgi:hypothetical protein